MATAKLIQIIYKEEQRQYCLPYSLVYFNDQLTVFFENSVISNTIPKISSEKYNKIAMCSWKLVDKMKWNVGKRVPLTEDALNSDYEVLSFTKNSKHHNALMAAENWHPGFKIILGKIMAQIGQHLPGEINTPIYQNHFSARIEIYKDYVRNWLGPAMYVMEHDLSIRKLCFVNSGYSELSNQSATHLKNSIGLDYYPMHPFLLERLFSIYCQKNKIKISHL